LPFSPVTSKGTQPKVILPKPPPLPAQSCEVAQNMRVPCGRRDISPSECEAINCCCDGQQCYFGKAVTVQCTKDAQFIVVVAKDATLPNLDLETVSLLGGGQGCTHVDSNSGFAIYHFPVTACGSIVMEESGVIIYENRMTSSYEVLISELGGITRDSHYELLFQCRYIGTSVEALVVQVFPIDNPPLSVAAPGPVKVQLRLANGQCHTKGCNEVDVAYSSFYTEADYPVLKVLRDPVYVEVQLLEKTDPLLVLTLGRCWANTSPYPHNLPQWDILIDGCPYRDDRYLSSVVPVDFSSGLDFPSHYRRFLFKMFTFVETDSMDPQTQQVKNISTIEKQLQQNIFLLFYQLLSLFRYTFTVIQLYALLHRAATVIHHASEKVRHELIICRIQEQYALKSDNVCVSVCRERCRGCGPEDD
uniref:Zona pellucida sperm-binding protein 4 n=2 Tax=Lates calcarifer TaxID=8187 RepID=A0A4W6E763_LATCA